MNSTVKRRSYDEDFKRNAVKVLIDSDKPVTAVAENLGVNQSMLHKWKKKFGADYSADRETATGAQPDVEFLKTEIYTLKETVTHLRSAVEKLLKSKYDGL